MPRDQGYAAGNFIGNILQGEDILIQGDGTPRRSYIYTADLVIWLLRILTKAKTGDIYNVGSHQDISISELAEYLVKAAAAWV
ncbi:MAG: NAD-dependent epimerase/dehydratase family protein [Turneriella sp.]|nr:NAD-dependent epimerase/dehydratase family protein [Turneriella sp.]